VFDESKAIRQAIEIFRNDPTISWRSLELAVVYDQLRLITLIYVVQTKGA
jgi:hypothetical protein